MLFKSLRTKILVLLIGSVLATMVLGGGGGILQTSRIVSEDSEQISNLICENKMQEINAWLLEIEQSVNTAYSFADAQFTEDETLWTDTAYMEQYTQQVGAVIRNAVENTGYAMSGYLRLNPELLVSVSGVLLVKNDVGEFVEMECTDLSLYDPSDREHVGWWYEPLENGGSTWMTPYKNQNIENVYMISYVIPIYRDDLTIGVIGMDIDFGFLEDKVDTIFVYDTGYALLLSEGDVVYSKEYAGGIDKNELEDELAGAGMRMVSSTMTNGMELVLVVPESEIYATRDHLIVQCLVILLVILVIAVLLSIRLTGQVTRPLLELTQAAERISNGERNVAIECKSKDEVGVLARTLKEAVEELNQCISCISDLAYTDHLTGMNNRHFINQYYSDYERKSGVSAGVVFCDVNGLKYTNDNFGHAEGDALIRSFADALQKSFAGGVCIRLSGDEFVAIVEEKSEAEFMQMVEALRAGNERNGVPMASVGWRWRERADSLQEMLSEAEEAMYADKALFHEKYPIYRRK